MRLRLFHKFAILLILLSIIPAAIVGLRTININRAGMQSAILELHTSIASSLADSAQNYLQALDREIQYVLRTLSGQQMTWDDRQSVLQSLLDTNENFASVSIVNRQGREMLKAYNPDLDKEPKLIDRKDDPTFLEFWKSPTASAISPVYFVDNDPRINIIYPLGRDHCLFTVVTLRAMWARITGARIASTGFAYMVDKEGRIIAHPDGRALQTGTDVSNLPIVVEALKAVSVGSKEYYHPGEKKYVVGAYAPVKRLGWGVIIQQDKDEAYVSVYKMRDQAVLLILISVLAAALIAFFSARTFVRPIMALTGAAKKIAGKDFSVVVNIKTRDELQDLAETFNDMTLELYKFNQMHIDELVAEKTKTDSVILSIADGIVMTDLEGRIQLLNTRAREIMDIPETGWHDKPLWDYVKHAGLKSSFEEVINQPSSHKTKDVDLSVGDLARFYHLSSEEVITPEKREKIGVVTVMRNVTLEKELDKMKEDFLHSITHDLRNPMTSIRGFLKFLIDGIAGPVNEQQKKMLETMDRASNRLMTLINDILDNAKLEAGRMALTLNEFDMRFIAQRTLDIAEGQALKKQIALSIDAPAELPKIKGDIELLERVITNLVGNALKFTPEGGKITVKIEEDGEMIRTSVIDTGEGIPPEYIDKIFDKFQQVAGQRRGGTGLGLTICKHVVEAHLGRIWAESKLGEGSKFIFTVPKNLKMSDILTGSTAAQEQA